VLDLQGVLPQLDILVQRRREWMEALDRQLLSAAERFENCMHPDIQARAQDAKTSWLVPVPLNPPNAVHHASPAAESYAAAAVDGSQLIADRHELADCLLMNIGTVLLRCGSEPFAQMESRAQLHADLPSEPAEYSGSAVRDAAFYRHLEEFQELIGLLTRADACAVPSAAFVDGTLILWAWENEVPARRARLITSFCEASETARRLRIPLMGYISAPGSRDVVNLLRIAACPFEMVDCDRHCASHRGPERPTAPCAGVEQLLDRHIFSRHLEQGQYSAVFASQSSILQEYPPEHRTAFCYLHVGNEVARLEFPMWLAHDAELLAQGLAIALEQARQGRGYPVCIAEAHEQAVVRLVDRRIFLQMVEERFLREGLPLQRSSKAASKERRAV
jgi:hypothetical protein